MTDEKKVEIVIDEKAQEAVGKEIDEVYAVQKMVNDNADKFKNDPALFLYRLPLSDDQRKAVFEGIMKREAEAKNRLI